jgi:hypothetical protein
MLRLVALMMLTIAACSPTWVATEASARQPQVSDAQVRELIVQESVGAYQASGRPCACPYNTMRNGAACGGRSAYSRPGGAAPICYPADVTDGQIKMWRTRNY